MRQRGITCPAVVFRSPVDCQFISNLFHPCCRPVYTIPANGIDNIGDGKDFGFSIYYRTSEDARISAHAAFPISVDSHLTLKAQIDPNTECGARHIVITLVAGGICLQGVGAS
jgi:hypothetical protein